MENRRIRDSDENGGTGDAPSPGKSKSSLPLCMSPSVPAAGDPAREEFIRSFQETLAENLLLKQAMRDKADQILHLKSKLLEMLEKQERDQDQDQTMELSSSSFSYLEQTEEILTTYANNLDYSGAGHENEKHNKSWALGTPFSESMIEWVEENKDDVLDKAGKGSFHVMEIGAGYLVGWLTAFALKTFGKIAVTALGGGLCLIQLAHYKGYIVVNWTGIFDEIQDKLDTTAAVFQPEPETSGATEGTPEKNGLATTPRNGGYQFPDFFRRWSLNSFSITGFVGGFIYKTYS